MMAFRIRELRDSPDDLKKYEALIESHEPTWSHPHPVTDARARSEGLLKSKVFRVFATESDAGALVMSIAVRLWDTMPYFSLIEFKTAERLSFGRFKAAFAPLLELVIREMETEDRFEFWYLIEDKDIYASREQREEADGRPRRNILQYLVPHLENYAIFTEVRIEAGETPRWPVYKSLLSLRPAKTATVIRRGIHKRKFEGR